MPVPNYMNEQAQINEKMRGILIDWIVDVHAKFNMKKETFFLTTNMIDRFLSKKQVSRDHL